MKKYVIYTRVASGYQVDKKKSINSQLRALEKYARAHDMTITKKLSEYGSANAAQRPIFQELMRIIKEGKVQGILCTNLDRLTRNYTVMNRLNKFLEKHKVKIITL